MSQQSVRVEFSGALTIQRAAEVRDRLSAAVAEGRDVTVDCRAASDADLTFVQLLLAARRTAQGAGRDLHLAAPLPPALMGVLERGGFVGAADGDKGFWSAGEG